MPPRGAPSEREALTRRLTDARAAARQPVTPGGPLPPPPTGAEGVGEVPLRPPAAPRLATAPRLRPEAPVTAAPGAAPEAAPELPADPGAPPAPPPAEFLAPPPPRL